MYLICRKGVIEIPCKREHDEYEIKFDDVRPSQKNG